MNVDLRVKCDPRADGREAAPGDLIEFWVRWSCPDDGAYLVKMTRVVGGDTDGAASTDCGSWDDVTALGETFGVVLPAQPFCLGY